ncbi:MAG: DUF1638 domain-containing protein [Rhizobiaceae bacterium]|nr:DUF1638 domain-containing protein [Rhizobiaceae bacterium]
MEKTQQNSQKVRVIACGMIAREVLAINEQMGFEHVDLKCLPAEYHHHPEKIAPEMDKAVLKARDEGFEHIFVGYADCGTGGELDKICSKHGVERITGPHCFSFYMGNQQFMEAGDDYLTTFFITDFLARHFETFMKKPLGLDRHPELLPMYFSHYTRALYLAQTEDPVLEQNARKAAEFMGLEYEYRFTGFGDLVPALSSAAQA